jgi:hypothetical protein
MERHRAYARSPPGPVQPKNDPLKAEQEALIAQFFMFIS